MNEYIHGNTFTDVTQKPFDPRPSFACCGWVRPIRNYVNTVEGPVSNIINVSAQIIPSLYVTLYNVDPTQNAEIIMEIGKKYEITYVTEDGVLNAGGKLLSINNMVVTENPVKLITGAPTNMDMVSITLDCSSPNQAVVITVYLRTIREIKEIVEEPPVDTPDQTE